MSQYVEFFLGNPNEGGKCLFSFSRSHPISKAFWDYVPYARAAEFKRTDYADIIDALNESISTYDKMIALSREKMAALANWSDPVNEKMEIWTEETEYIRDAEDSKREDERVKEFIHFLTFMNDGCNMWIGIEVVINNDESSI